MLFVFNNHLIQIHRKRLNNQEFDAENSYIATTRKSTNPDAAEIFRSFVLGNDGQAILSKYNVGLN